MTLDGKDISELERLAPVMAMLVSEHGAMMNLKHIRSLYPSESIYLNDLEMALYEIRDKVRLGLRSIYTNEVND